MDEDIVRKNILDLSYKRNLQLLNIALIIGGGSFVAYLAGFVLNPEKLAQYTTLLAIISIITLLVYKRINNELKNISEQIKKLVK